MMSCSCGMLDQQKVSSLISSRAKCCNYSPSQISNTPQVGFEPAQNLSSAFFKLSCADTLTTTPRHDNIIMKIKEPHIS